MDVPLQVYWRWRMAVFAPPSLVVFNKLLFTQQGWVECQRGSNYHRPSSSRVALQANPGIAPPVAELCLTETTTSLAEIWFLSLVPFLSLLPEQLQDMTIYTPHFAQVPILTEVSSPVAQMGAPHSDFSSRGAQSTVCYLTILASTQQM